MTDEDHLRSLYGEPRPMSLRKELDHLSAEYVRFIEASPFMAMATGGVDGLDCSPRGDRDRVVDVVDAHTLRFADRRGNNRLDSLRNLLVDDRVALLFFVPGIVETMRVNGRATISVDPELLAMYEVDGSLPRTVIEVRVERAYFQCSRATLRSGLWDPARHADRGALPSCGQMLEGLSGGEVDGAAYDADLAERLPDSLY